MAVPVIKFPIFMIVRVLGIMITALVFAWTLHYRGGLTFISDSKDLIFSGVMKLSGAKSHKAKINIINNASGIIKPGRYKRIIS
ncbi:hypothetical protein CCACVL1_13165 [Corchorus capsularis]|uniref:Uncharacterized protein n=1 Tax=Corchorus capsularis TaxID=210143 RepID=A0A1R3IC35_COCAP|nr:hypothetical protein CCACVL1_13165 [Corchorus capsularis]